MGNTVSCEITDEIALVTMNNPPVNQFTDELINDLVETFEGLQDEKLRVVVLTGTGTAFQAGADLNSFLKVKTAEDGIEFIKLCQRITGVVAAIPCPVIAMVNGLALGGGTELALACDIRIASSEATFGLPEVSWGAYPGAGGTKRLPDLIGPGKAKMLLFSGKIIKAEEALSLGLVENVVEPDKLLETTMKLANKIARNSPSAVRAVKGIVNKGYNLSVKEALEVEAAAAGAQVMTGDMMEGANAFLEKRKPVYEVK